MEHQPNGIAASSDDLQQFKLKFSQILRFLEFAFPVITCPQCGKDAGWLFDGRPGLKGVEQELAIYRMGHSSHELAHPFYLSSCNNCGSIRQISCRRVHAWIAENPGEATP